MEKYNPFRPNSIVTPGMFAGRYDEIRRSEQALFQTKHDNPQHFLIEGERGIGKSSLFRLLDWTARGQIKTLSGLRLNFIVANIELREAMGRDDIIDAIVLELKRQIADKENLKEMCRKAWDFLSRFEVYGVSYKQSEREGVNDRLDELTTALVDLITGAGDSIDGILILIDEADKPPVSAQLGELCKLLTERLSRKGCERVGLRLTGLPGLVLKLRNSHESAPRVFSTMPLDTLEDGECKEVIRRGLLEAEDINDFKTEISDSALDLITNLSEGYPHFIQEFAHCAFDQDNDNHIDPKDVIKGAFTENGALDQLGKRYFADLYITQIGSEDYRKVLFAMAESLDGWVARPEIIRRSGVKERTVDNALRALKDRNIIIPNDRARGEYRLPTRSFAVWIRARETAYASLELDDPMFPGLDQ